MKATPGGSRSDVGNVVNEQPDASAPRGVSVVICCHNSAERLVPTMAHLAAQQVHCGVAWEVLLVDNASTDATTAVAVQAWPAEPPAPLRTVREPRLGLIHARRRGFTEAAYEYVSFIDDDNWVATDWVQRVFELMSQHNQVGACGGYVEAVYEVPPPPWFARVEHGYHTVGAQANEAGDITDSQHGWLWGAGLTVRRSAWQELQEAGYRSLLVGREGTKLTTGEDLEISLALRLAGWRLWYDPCLRLRHFLPSHRLDWSYMRRLGRFGGAATVGHDPYFLAMGAPSAVRMDVLRHTWPWQIGASLRKLLRHRAKLFQLLSCPLEGDRDVLEIEGQIGRIGELLRQRGAYHQRLRQVRTAPWRSMQTRA